MSLNLNKRLTVETFIINCINTKVFRLGDKIPSLRDVSRKKGVSISTALGAYDDLVSLGILETRPRAGYFVATEDQATIRGLLRDMKGPDAVPFHETVVHSADERRYLDYYNNNTSCNSADERHLLATEAIDEEFFAESAIYTHFRKVVLQGFSSIRGDDSVNAEGELASEIIRWMLSTGAIFIKDHIRITFNARDAIQVAMRAFYTPGCVFAIESPGHAGFYASAKFLGVDYVEIPSDPQDGFDVDRFVDCINKGVRFCGVILSSSHSNPAGGVMPLRSKEKLIEVCEREEIPIIEYDGTGRMGFSDRQSKPIKCINPEIVVYISEFSMVFGTGYSVGWLECGKYINRVSFIKALAGIRVPPAPPLAIADFMASKSIVRYMQSLSERMEANAALFYRTVKECAPEALRVFMPRGGPFMWFELPEGFDADALYAFAARQNVFIAPGQLFSSGVRAKRSFRVNCCVTADPVRLAGSAQALGRVVTEFLGETLRA